MPEQLDANNEEARKAKRQLLVRGATAAALVVALLAVLVIVDKKPQSETEQEVVARTVTPQAAKPVEETKPALADSARELVEKSEDAPTVADASLQMSAPEASPVTAVPEETADPTAPVLGVPNKVPASAVLRQPAATKPATASAAGVPTTPRLTLGTEAPPKPVVTPPEAKSASAVKDGFVVQMGVFTDYNNAEQLRNKLSAAGINAQLETRVQVGPFKTRKEALEAQAKLSKLGMSKGMVVAGH